MRPCSERDKQQPLLPVLCVDLTAGEGKIENRRRQQRRRAFARLGVDHYWDLDTQAMALDSDVRTDDEYRHVERLTGAERLDYGIGLVHLNIPLLVQIQAERQDEPW